MFKSLSYLEFIFVYDERVCSDFVGFLYFYALFIEEGLLFSPYYSLELWI